MVKHGEAFRASKRKTAKAIYRYHPAVKPSDSHDSPALVTRATQRRSLVFAAWMKYGLSASWDCSLSGGNAAAGEWISAVSHQEKQFDSIQRHRQLACTQLHRMRSGFHSWQLKGTFL
jgi:hypothetical protein